MRGSVLLELGLRLGSGLRSSWAARLLAMAISALAVFMLCSVASGPSVVKAQAERTAHQYPVYQESSDPHHGGVRIFDRPVSTTYGVLTLRVVAAPTSVVLPGLVRPLRVDEVAFSPRLAELVSTGRLPSPAPIGEQSPLRIGPAGTVAPDTLVAYRAIATSKFPPHAFPASGFGVDPKLFWEPAKTRALMWGIGLFLATPTILALASVMRLHASSRRAQQVRLRYLGLPASRALVVTLVDPVAAAVTGGAVGALAYYLVRRHVDHIAGLPSYWYPHDIELSPLTAAGVCLGVPVLAAWMSVARSHGSFSTGHGRPTVQRRVSMFALAPFIAGLTGIVLCVAKGADIHGSDHWAAVLLVSVTLACLGLPWAVAWCIAQIASLRVLDATVVTQLSRHRLAVQGQGTTRAGGILGATILLLAAVAPVLAAVSRSPANLQAQLSEANRTLVLVHEVLPDTRQRLLEYVKRNSPSTAIALTRSPDHAFQYSPHLSCPQLRAVVGTAPCHPGVVSFGEPTARTFRPNHQDRPIPVQAIASPFSAEFAMSGSIAVIDPSSSSDRTSNVASAYLIAMKPPTADPSAVQNLAIDLAEIAPTAQISIVGSEAYYSYTARQHLQSWLRAASIALAALCLLGLLTSTIAGWVENLPSLAGIFALGARPGLLRRSFGLQLGSCLLLALGLGGTTGILVADASAQLTGVRPLTTAQFAQAGMVSLIVAAIVAIVTALAIPCSYNPAVLRRD